MYYTYYIFYQKWQPVWQLMLVNSGKYHFISSCYSCANNLASTVYHNNHLAFSIVRYCPKTYKVTLSSNFQLDRLRICEYTIFFGKTIVKVPFCYHHVCFSPFNQSHSLHEPGKADSVHGQHRLWFWGAAGQRWSHYWWAEGPWETQQAAAGVVFYNATKTVKYSTISG